MSEMIEVSAHDLTGDALDWATAVAVGEKSPQRGLGGGCVVSHGHTLHRFCPSKEWAHGGPLLEKYRIGLDPWLANSDWNALSWDIEKPMATGSTPLIALCRAIVAANLGNRVQVPAELHLSPGLAQRTVKAP